MPRGEPLIRQWNVLKAIQNHRFGISTDELAERVEYSKRQVLRDINVLQQVGFPIGYEIRDGGRKFWKLSANFIEKEGLILSMTEMLSLFLSQQLLAPLGGTELGSGLASALDKIKSLLPRKALDYFGSLDDKLLVKSAGFHDYSPQHKEIRLLNQAIMETRVILVRYQSPAKAEPEANKFHPYGMVFLSGNLYCIGHLESCGEIRTLKVNRILGVELTSRTFEMPEDFSLQKYTRGSFGIISSGRYQFVCVKLTGWAATNIQENQWHWTQKIIEEKKGTVVVQFELNDFTEFKRWILGFGRCAVVLEPQELAKEIFKELSAARSEYEKPTPRKAAT